VGDTVVIWVNNDPTIHTVTEGKTDNKSPKEFDSEMLGPNDTFKHTFMRTGVFDYHCVVHPFMTGKVMVISG
jgi:plastocyanin